MTHRRIANLIQEIFRLPSSGLLGMKLYKIMMHDVSFFLAVNAENAT